MKFNTLFAVRKESLAIDLSVLFLRVVTGVAFMLHGWGKIQAPFAWMPPGAPVPGVLQALAAISEFGGGFALIIGLVTRLSALGLVFTMIGATLTHMVIAGDPFVSQGGPSYELALVYLAISVYLLQAGPGRVSLDRVLFGRK